MEKITTFINRLKKLGIEVTLFANYPWVYLDTVNGKKVEGTYEADHGFTAFWVPIMKDRPVHMTNIRVVFNKIKEML